MVCVLALGVMPIVGCGGNGGTGGVGGFGGSGGAGGTQVFVFQDTIQTETDAWWGFSDAACHRPVDGDGDPTCADAQGVNISRVADPAGGGGYALRFYTELNGIGVRAQLGVYGAWDATFNAAASSGNPIYCAMEMYIPSPAWYLNSGTGGWMSLGDFHTLQPGGGGRYHTSPGFMINRGGANTIQFAWNGMSGNGNGSPYSTTAMPTDEWFDFEVGWQHSPNYDATVQLWMDGTLGLTQSNVRTANSAASTETEFYIKQYGDDYGEVWNPEPQIRYVRNVRCSASPITH